MKKNHTRVFATILVVVISLAMVISGFAMFFTNTGVPPAGPNTPPANTLADYQALKVRLADLAKRAEADPTNVPLQTDLGNEYYDAAEEAVTVAPTEAQENYKQAVVAYQNVLKTTKDINVMIDMANAAFYSGNDDLAEKTYKEALVLQPDSYDALGNYGVFLSQAKQDWAGALIQWQKALPLAQSSDDKSRINDLISQANTQLKASTSGGVTNPNPALNNGTTTPVTPAK